MLSSQQKIILLGKQQKAATSILPTCADLKTELTGQKIYIIQMCHLGVSGLLCTHPNHLQRLPESFSFSVLLCV